MSSSGDDDTRRPTRVKDSYGYEPGGRSEGGVRDARLKRRKKSKAATTGERGIDPINTALGLLSGVGQGFLANTADDIARNAGGGEFFEERRQAAPIAYEIGRNLGAVGNPLNLLSLRGALGKAKRAAQGLEATQFQKVVGNPLYVSGSGGLQGAWMGLGAGDTDAAMEDRLANVPFSAAFGAAAPYVLAPAVRGTTMLGGRVTGLGGEQVYDLAKGATVDDLARVLAQRQIGRMESEDPLLPLRGMETSRPLVGRGAIDPEAADARGVAALIDRRPSGPLNRDNNAERRFMAGDEARREGQLGTEMRAALAGQDRLSTRLVFDDAVASPDPFSGPIDVPKPPIRVRDPEAVMTPAQRSQLQQLEAARRAELARVKAAEKKLRTAAPTKSGRPSRAQVKAEEARAAAEARYDALNAEILALKKATADPTYVDPLAGQTMQPAAGKRSANGQNLAEPAPRTAKPGRRTITDEEARIVANAMRDDSRHDDYMRTVASLDQRSRAAVLRHVEDDLYGVTGSARDQDGLMQALAQDPRLSTRYRTLTRSLGVQDDQDALPLYRALDVPRGMDSRQRSEVIAMRGRQAIEGLDPAEAEAIDAMLLGERIGQPNYGPMTDRRYKPPRLATGLGPAVREAMTAPRGLQGVLPDADAPLPLRVRKQRRSLGMSAQDVVNFDPNLMLLAKAAKAPLTLNVEQGLRGEGVFNDEREAKTFHGTNIVDGETGLPIGRTLSEDEGGPVDGLLKQLARAIGSSPRTPYGDNVAYVGDQPVILDEADYAAWRDQVDEKRLMERTISDLDAREGGEKFGRAREMAAELEAKRKSAANAVGAAQRRVNNASAAYRRAVNDGLDGAAARSAVSKANAELREARKALAAVDAGSPDLVRARDALGTYGKRRADVEAIRDRPVITPKIKRKAR